MADIVQDCTEALTAIIGGAATVQTITGRTTKNCLSHNTKDPLARLPVLLLAFLGGTQRGGLGDTRTLRYQVTAFAKGNSADATANALIEAVENGVTQPALDALDVDGYVESMRRYRIGTGDEPGLTGRADLDLTLVIRKH